MHIGEQIRDGCFFAVLIGSSFHFRLAQALGSLEGLRSLRRDKFLFVCGEGGSTFVVALEFTLQQDMS